MTNTPTYRRPGWFTRQLNRSMSALARRGISIWGSRILEVRGRTSGLPRRVPVNPLDLDDGRYLVSPRGQTEWVRNVRADDGHLSLLLGRRREELVATEVADDEKARILREYLRRWKFEVGMFFDGVGPDSTDEALMAIAPKHPVFRLAPATPTAG
jgi:deazaflavin-dependent oxidoreductase (nitroreductase family)